MNNPILCKKLAVISNISLIVTDSKKNLEEAFVVWDSQTIKWIIRNVKSNKSKEEVSSLFNSSSEAFLIFGSYSTQLYLTVLDLSWSLVSINKHQINIQKIVFADFEISDSVSFTQWFQ